MTHVFLLHGGLFSTDGVVTSLGMKRLAGMVRNEGIPCEEYLWGSWVQCYRDMMATREKTVIVGYSGGGARATWVANGNLKNDGTFSRKPTIDLMVTYDPSPTWSMMPLQKNVKMAVNYWNKMPLMFGIGGAKLEGDQVENFPIYSQHLAVQYRDDLHRRTVELIKKL